MFVNKQYIPGACISKRKQCYNAKPSEYYFYLKTKILVDFHICINVPLKQRLSISLAKYVELFCYDCN